MGRIIMSSGGDPAGAESFRFLAHRLQQIRQKRPISSLLVTSPGPKEGKTTVAANLALTLLQTSRTLLVDCDLRNPAVSRLFRTGPRPGLAEFLSGSHSLDAVLCRLDPFGLTCLPAGSCPGDPVTLLRESKLRQLLEEVTPSFDWIILDAPPVNLVAESACLSALCDGTLLVIRSGVTRRKDFEKATATLEGSFVAGLLMNACDDPDDRSYYAYAATSRGDGDNR
jgi:capsular exopolysaccharide synthesis family protein